MQMLYFAIFLLLYFDNFQKESFRTADLDSYGEKQK